MLYNDEREKWHVKDVIFAVFLYIITVAFIYARLRSLSFITDNLADGFSNFLAGSIVIYVLNHKYPLRLLSAFHVRSTLMYSLSGLMACFVVYLPFYSTIWSGSLEEIPKYYIVFTEANVFGKFFSILYLCFLAPLVEEVFIRGFIYRILKNKYNILWGTVFSTMVFYLLHGVDIENLMNIKIIFVSLVLTFVYERTGTIWSSVITHSLNNILWFILLYLGSLLSQR
jgi:membrane protease YdiL (CAAX protease family)